VGDISGDTGAAADIKEGELGDERVLLEQERQRLSDSTYRSKRVRKEVFAFEAYPRSSTKRERDEPAAPRTATLTAEARVEEKARRPRTVRVMGEIIFGSCTRRRKDVSSLGAVLNPRPLLPSRSCSTSLVLDVKVLRLDAEQVPPLCPSS
jgi:hypothetical protein